jgi:hypothetical protein
MRATRGVAAGAVLIAGASVGNPDSFWTVYLRRQPDGRWLITNYGQG